MKKTILGIGAVLILLIASGACKRTETPPQDQAKAMADLQVSDNFNWSTVKPSTFKVTALDNANNAIEGAKILIYTADPDSADGKLIVSGLTNTNGVYMIDYEVPAYYTQLFVATDYVGLPTPGMINLDNSGFDIVLGGQQQKASFKSVLQPKSTNANYKFLGGYNSAGVPDYLEPVGDVVDNLLLKDINNTLPERVRLPSYRPEYFANDINPDISLIDFADVWVTFVHEGAGYRNVLGFYTYPTDQPPATPDDIDSITIIFPNASFQGSGGGLHSGDKVKIGTFPGNTSIGFALMANGWKNGGVTDGKWIVYTDKQLNPETDPALKQHTVLLSDNARDLVLLGIEDIRRDKPYCDHDFNDAIFYVTASPIQSVDQNDLPLVDYTGSDGDGDGVPDNFDDYPADPDMAFNNYYFNQGDFGTLSFEDLWPAVGDYDFNDAVIDYNFNQITNGDNKLVKIQATFILRAHGAFFHNGFGFEIPIANNLVSSVSGQMSITGDLVTLDSRNLEAGQTNAVIIVWDDAYDVLPQAGAGVGVNTEPETPFVTPDTLSLTITFTQAVNLSDVGHPPYNPFIIVNQERGVEVHLPNKQPTDLADLTLLGTDADNSIPAQGRYYKTSTNLPWAINIIESFEYPVEKVEITAAYLKFAEWAESSGQVSYDWWKDKTGYRNSENIYQPAK
ncbi:MAG: LruC domain-containing protein [Chlorobi bacterium]|nr:LruC domain-containing protein [Chlorobiota bacterium]